MRNSVRDVRDWLNFCILQFFNKKKMVKMGYIEIMYWVTAWDFKNVSQTYLFLTTTKILLVYAEDQVVIVTIVSKLENTQIIEVKVIGNSNLYFLLLKTKIC